MYPKLHTAHIPWSFGPVVVTAGIDVVKPPISLKTQTLHLEKLNTGYLLPIVVFFPKGANFLLRQLYLFWHFSAACHYSVCVARHQFLRGAYLPYNKMPGQAKGRIIIVFDVPTPLPQNYLPPWYLEPLWFFNQNRFWDLFGYILG